MSDESFEIIQHGKATAQLHAWDDARTPKDMAKSMRSLTHLYVDPDHRNKGHASRLLKKLQNRANDEKLIIVAHPYHYESDTDKLIKFYEANGFKKIQDSPALMALFPTD